MLHLLTDEHISPAVAIQCRRKSPGMDIIPIHNWHDGDFLGMPDHAIIAQAHRQRITLVSYDQRTLRPLLKALAEQGVDHGGLVFIDEKTISPADIGSQVKSLLALWKSERTADWTNRVVFLKRSP